MLPEKSNNAEDAAGLHILVVNYNYVEPPTDEKMSSDVKQYAPVFSNENFPGMIGKTVTTVIKNLRRSLLFQS